MKERECGMDLQYGGSSVGCSTRPSLKATKEFWHLIYLILTQNGVILILNVAFVCIYSDSRKTPYCPWEWLPFFVLQFCQMDVLPGEVAQFWPWVTKRGTELLQILFGKMQAFYLDHIFPSYFWKLEKFMQLILRFNWLWCYLSAENNCRTHPNSWYQESPWIGQFSFKLWCSVEDWRLIRKLTWKKSQSSEDTVNPTFKEYETATR